MTIPAKYENGVFKPLEDIKLSEGTVVEVHVPSHARSLGEKRCSLREFGFVGMWKDREEMADSVAYVNRLRGNLRG